MKLFAAGVSHKTAPVALREQLAVKQSELVDLAFGKADLSQQSIMVLGAGAMAESCVRLLVEKGAKSIFISNRSFDRALDLATRCGVEAVCFGYSLFEMREVDVVIAATSSAETLLSRDDVDNLMKARRNRPLLLISGSRRLWSGLEKLLFGDRQI